LQEHIVSSYNKNRYRDKIFAQIPLPDPLFGTISVFDEKHIIMRPENASFYTLVAPQYFSFFDSTVRECSFSSGSPQVLLSFSNTSNDNASIIGIYSTVGYNNTQTKLTQVTNNPLNTSGLSLGLGAHTLIDFNDFYFFAMGGISSDTHQIDIPAASLTSTQSKDLAEPGTLHFSGKTGIGTSIPFNTLLLNSSLNVAYYQTSLKETSYPAETNVSISQNGTNGAWIVPGASLHLQQYFSGFDTTRIGITATLHAGYSFSVGDPSWVYQVGFAKQTVHLDNPRFDASMRSAFVIQIAQSLSLNLYAQIGRTFNNSDFSSAFLNTGVYFESLF
jgi:hypothetical protein